MAEKTPLSYDYSIGQGRLEPTVVNTFDGKWMYILGHVAQIPYDLLYGDYIEISQDLDLTSINTVWASANIIQPNIQAGRSLVDAELKRSEVLPVSQPTTYSKIVGHFNIPAGSKLRIEVDGTGDVDAEFTTGGIYTAAEAATIIDAAITGSNGESYASGDSGSEVVYIRSKSTGIGATIEVKTYPGPGDDANDRMDFHKKVARPLVTDTKIYGGDDLSAIIAAGANFTEADIGLPVQISGAATPGNNFVNHIAGIVDSETAILKYSIVDEPPGFSAVIASSLWKFSLHIDSWEAASVLLDRSRELMTTDIAANVSKIETTATVKLRMELLSV
jgi:hypothetical protein